MLLDGSLLFDQTPAAYRFSQADAITPTNALYGPAGADIVSSTGVPAVGDLYAFPFLECYNGTIDQIGINVTVSGTNPAALVRYGIYTSEGPSNLAPGGLLFDSGDIATTSTGAKLTTISPALTLEAGKIYWLSVIYGTQAPTVTTFSSGWHFFGRNTNFNAQFGWQKVGFGYGALPATFPIIPQPGVCSSTPTLIVVRFATYKRVIGQSAGYMTSVGSE